MKHFLLVIIQWAVLSLGAWAQTPSVFFGINGWMPKEVGDASDHNLTNLNFNTNGKLYDIMDNSTLIQGLGVKLYRYGGILHDINGPTAGTNSVTNQYMEFINKVRSIGGEPLIQIPNSTTMATA